MISVGHRSLSGRAIRLIIWSTEFKSQIDLFLFNIKLFYKFSKSLIIRLFKALMKLPLSIGYRHSLSIYSVQDCKADSLMASSAIQFSRYYSGLEGEAKSRYEQKIRMIGPVDPYYCVESVTSSSFSSVEWYE